MDHELESTPLVTDPAGPTASPAPRTPSVGIVGAGNLGLLYAASFGLVARATDPVVLVTRQRTVREAVNAHGVHVRVDFESAPGARKAFGVQHVRAMSPGEIGEQDRRDIVLILSRSADSEYAVDAAERLAHRGSLVVMLQNGLRGWTETARLSMPHVTGATYQGAWALSENEVVWSFPGATVIPGADLSAEAASAVRDAFANASLPLERSPLSEAEIVWRKTLGTVPNWVAAALGVPAGAVFTASSASDLIRVLVEEGVRVASRDGAQISVEDLLADFARFRTAARHAKGSAYSALERGQPLEVLDICESIAERVLEHGVAAPTMQAVMRLARIQHEVFPWHPRAEPQS